jgi:hypothetical protein
LRPIRSTALSSGHSRKSSGIVWNWTGAVGASGSGTCQRLAVENLPGADPDDAWVRALAAYKDLLSLLKDADSDIPILKEAQAQYARAL